MSAYCYSPLTLTTSIRVIQLLPEDDFQRDTPTDVDSSSTVDKPSHISPIRCQLVEYDLRHPSATSHPYEALSYVWGSEEKPLEIFVGDDGRSLAVTQNLYTALVRLRNPTCARTLWIDGICINQSDDVEKAQQIGLMMEVYAKATRVLVWLGHTESETDGGDDIGMSLETIRSAGEWAMLSSLREGGTEPVPDPAGAEGVEEIQRFLRRPWFRRIWVLQEMASARSVVMLCGAMQIDGFVFASGLDALSSTIMTASVPPVVSLIKQAIFRPRYGVLPQERETPPILLRSTSLAGLVDNYHDHQASRLHDKVYALIGMCNDHLYGTGGLELNYALPWKTLLQRLTQKLLGDVSVQTWDDRQAAVIVSKGHVLGQISKVEERVGPNFGQTVKATFQNTFDVERSNYWKRTARWTLSSAAKRVQVGDIICQLQYAPAISIVRFCGDYFALIICAANPPAFFLSEQDETDESDLWESHPDETDESDLWESHSDEIDESDPWESHPDCTFQSCEFLLLWAWEPINSPQELLEEAASPSGDIETLVVDGAKESEQRTIGVAARTWQTGLILENCGRHELAKEKRQLAIRAYQTVTGEQYEDSAEDQQSLTPLCWAASRGDASLVEKILAHNADGINVKDGSTGSTPLLWAAKNGHVSVMRKLLDFDKLDINEKDIEGETALSEASRAGHETAVALLLTRPEINVDAKNSTGGTAFSWAARNGHHKLVKLLLDTGLVDLNARLEEVLRTPLMSAARYGHVAVVETLLEFGRTHESPDDDPSRKELSLRSTEDKAPPQDPKHAVDHRPVDVSARCVDGYTALIRAARYGHRDVVKLLVKECSNDLEHKDTKYGETALTWAAENGHDAVVEVLLNAGADPKTTSADGKTPLIWAASEGHVEVIKHLLEACSQEIETKDTKYGQTALSWAAEYGHINAVEELLRAGAEANTTSHTGRTPLSHAAAKGREDVVDRLIHNEGTDIGLADQKYGQTPLIWAIENDHTAVAKKLIVLEHLDVNARCNNGQSALSWAAERGNTAVIESILARGDVEIDSSNKLGRTPLSLAVEGGYEEAVKVLLTTDKADILHLGHDGTSMLTYAAKKGHSAIVKILLDAGSDTSVRDEQYGETALMWAAESGHEDAVRVLIAAGNTDLDLLCHSGKSALIRAAENGHGPTMKALLDAGSDVNLQDRFFGQTALSWAAEYGQVDSVRVLLARSDIDVDAKRSIYGKTALDYAVEKGHNDIVELLKAHGAQE